MTQFKTLQYHPARDRDWDKPPIGEVGLYYTVLGMTVVGLQLAVKLMTTGTEILLPLGVLFWAAGIIVSMMGMLRRPGRRCALAGVAMTCFGLAIYIGFFR